MKGSRAPRGLVNRAGEIAGENYTGDAAGIVTPWGGGAAGVSTPTIGVAPTLTIPIDDSDDGKDALASKAAASGRRVAKDTTKARFRTQLKTIANYFAWFMEIVAGTRSFRNLIIDGTGGVGGLVGAAGSISATGDAIIGGSVAVASSAGGVAAPTPAFVRGTVYKESGIFAAALVSSAGGGTFVSGLNIASFVRNSTGVYTLTMNVAAVSAARLIPMATLAAVNGFIEAIAGSASTIVVSTFNSAGVLTDESFSLLAFAV